MKGIRPRKASVSMIGFVYEQIEWLLSVVRSLRAIGSADEKSGSFWSGWGAFFGLGISAGDSKRAK